MIRAERRSSVSRPPVLETPTHRATDITTGSNNPKSTGLAEHSRSGTPDLATGKGRAPQPARCPMRRWWEDPGMTRSADIAEAAMKAGVYLDLREHSHQGQSVGDVPMVVVRAHGGPWILYPDPAMILGWVAEQIEYQPNGDITVLDGTTGWLGTGDLDIDAILRGVRALDYRGWLVVEQDVIPVPGTPTDASALDQDRNRAYLRARGL